MGTPVACSNTSSLPEVGGDSAEYFDPKSPEDIVAAVERAIGNREILGWQKKACDQASKFTFERTARLLKGAMRDVDEGKRAISIQSHPSEGMQTDMVMFWQSFPGVDAILLGAGRTISENLAPDLLRVVTLLDAARLDPRKLSMLVSRGDKLPPNGTEWTLNEYKHFLKLVAENKLFVCSLPDAEENQTQSFSRLEALKVMLKRPAAA